jgi:hypothetical protein
VNQPERIFFYYHYQPYGPYWDLIKDKLELVKVPLVSFVSSFDYKDKFINQFRYAHHSDFIRLEKLLEKGGVYADMDTLFVNKLPEHLFQKPFVLGREPDILDPKTKQPKPSLCNAFIMSEANAAFGEKWLENMVKAFDGTWSHHATVYPYKLSKKFPEEIHIEPVESFYKLPSTLDGIADIFENLRTDYQDMYSIHLWAHLWWDPLRIDFSTFYGNRITEEYVRQASTTYAVIARKFLPQSVITTETTRKNIHLIKYLLLVLKTMMRFIGIGLLGDKLTPNASDDMALVKKQIRFLIRLPFSKE